ncbi:hypothetical protein [Sorangium sp. So ce1000]
MLTAPPEPPGIADAGNARADRAFLIDNAQPAGGGRLENTDHVVRA